MDCSDLSEGAAWPLEVSSTSLPPATQCDKTSLNWSKGTFPTREHPTVPVPGGDDVIPWAAAAPGQCEAVRRWHRVDVTQLTPELTQHSKCCHYTQNNLVWKRPKVHQVQPLTWSIFITNPFKSSAITFFSPLLGISFHLGLGPQADAPRPTVSRGAPWKIISI